VKKLFSAALLLLFGCGYHFEGSRNDHGTVSVSIPYIKGDSGGVLNSELAKAFASSGLFGYVQNGGELTLQAAILVDGDERIGFRFDRDPTTGDRRDNIIGTENRRSMTIEIRLLDSHTQEVLVGPKTIVAFADYDYVDSNSIRDLTFRPEHHHHEKTLDFSLGQLDSLDGAHQDASVPIFRLAAQKIVDGLLNRVVLERIAAQAAD
jgi:hypothetical protein